jgi:2-dehydropantoate 2-reductase
MKITIVGPGSMGCLFAGFLSKQKSKHQVWLLDKTLDRAKRISLSGIVIEGISNLKTSVNITTDAKSIGPCDLVIIATKAYDTEQALKSIGPLVSDESNILTLQNGIGNAQLITDMFGLERTVCGITYHGAWCISDGRVNHAGKGETIIGKPTGKIFRDLRNISNAFNEAGILTKTSKDITGVQWSKLIINAGINPLSAICRIPNGSLIKHEGTREIMRQLVVEAAKTAKKNKVKLVYEDPIGKAESVCESTCSNISSMLQDVLGKKRTEIDFINGAVSRYAKSAGIKTPANDMIAQIIRAIEASYKEQAGI